MSDINKNNISNENEFEEFHQVKLTAWQSVKQFFSELIDIRPNTDREATIEVVKEDISFKGHTAWILIFSIFVASIGLNVSSTAVVIGAMLISPLMGPIVGLGISVAINDVETLKRSLINLGVMVVLSVITAYLYFKLSPLTEETPELISRTYPTILDVLVAIFGGLALIVAKTKKGTMASVIFGVAIATALMPPLCTVGYGLAVGNMAYAGGALYLFSINTVFIALSTFVVAKLLGFPMVRYVDSKRRKFIARMASVIAIIAMIPSVFLFMQLLKKQVFENKVKEYITEVIHYKGAEVIKFSQDYDKKDLELYLIGKVVPQTVIQTWQEKLKNFNQLSDANLHIYQGADQSGELAEKLSGEIKAGILEDLYVKNEQLLNDKDEQISFLEEEIAKLKVKELPFVDLSKEVKVLFKDVDNFSYSKKITTNFKNIDTIPVFDVQWNKALKKDLVLEQNNKLRDWLKLKLKLDTLLVK